MVDQDLILGFHMVTQAKYISTAWCAPPSKKPVNYPKFWFWVTLEVLIAHSWLCAQERVLVGLREPLGCQGSNELTACKAALYMLYYLLGPNPKVDFSQQRSYNNNLEESTYLCFHLLPGAIVTIRLSNDKNSGENKPFDPRLNKIFSCSD